MGDLLPELSWKPQPLALLIDPEQALWYKVISYVLSERSESEPGWEVDGMARTLEIQLEPLYKEFKKTP